MTAQKCLFYSIFVLVISCYSSPATFSFVDVHFLGNGGFRWILNHGNAHVPCNVLTSPGPKPCQIIFVGKQTSVYILVMLEPSGAMILN